MKKTRKGNLVYGLALNPGIIFVVLIMATSILIAIHKAGDKAPDMNISGRNTLSPPVTVAYMEDNGRGSTIPVSLKGKGNLYSENNPDENNNLPVKDLFQDVTLESGIEFIHVQAGMMLNAISEVVGPGACTADYDNDGFPDIYAVNGAGYTHYYGEKWWWYKGPHNTLYHNNGDGTFSDVTEKTEVGDSGWGMGCAFGDYDNDGNSDLYVTNYGANILYHNNGDGTFTDVTENAGVGDDGWGTSLAWGDYDNDGDLDIYVANYIVFDKTMNPGEPNSAFKLNMPLLMNSKLFDGQRNVLYRNNGDGTFTDVANKAGVGNAPGKSMGVLFSDFNDDGYQDIYIVNDKSRNVLYLNNGEGEFTDAGGTLGVDSPLSGMGVAVGDYDNDGDMDIFSTYAQKNTNILYNNTMMESKRSGRENTSRKFVDVAVDAGMGEDASVGYFGWGTGLFDYDNDGYSDIFVANGHGMPDFDNPRSTIGQKNQLFRNNGDGAFVEVSGIAGSGFKLMNSSRGCALGDYDNDGNIDIFVMNNNGYATLLKNVGSSANNWINIKLRGASSNRDAVGARVRVVSGDLSQTKDVSSGSGYLSQNDTRLNFGLGKNATVDLIEIRWPGGSKGTFRGIKANRFINIVEGEESFSIINTIEKKNGIHSTETEDIQTNKRIIENPEVIEQVLTALGETGDARAIKPLLLSLRDSEPGIRSKAVKALRHFDSDKAIGPIILALSDGDAAVRRETAATLAYIMKTEQTIRKASVQRKRLAVPPLLRVLDDEDPEVRQEAVKALGFSESYRASIPVARLLDDAVKEVRKEAAVTLGLLRDKRAVKPLIKILKDADEDVSVRAKAVISLNRLESRITVGPLLKALKDEDSKARQKAAAVFAALFEDKEGVVFRKKEAVKHLVGALADNDQLVRRAIVKALGLANDSQVKEFLIRSLTDKDNGVRQNAVKALGNLGGKDIVPHIINIMGDINHEVRKEAVIVLGNLRDSAAIPHLINILENGENPEARKQAAISLGAFKDKKVVEVLLKMVKTEVEDLSVRLSAIKTLCKIEGDLEPEIFSDLLDDSNYEIRKVAVRCLGIIKNKKLINILIIKLSDKDKDVRREAVLALGRHKDNRVFDALVNVLLNTDEDEQVRSGAVLYLGRSGNRKALLPLLKVLKNRGDNVRLGVVKALETYKDELVFKHLMMIIKNRHEDTQLRSEAIMAMVRMDNEKVLETLIGLIN